MRYLTAGESHGRALVGILEGMPAGVSVRAEVVDRDLYRRQQGYGRGGRMRIESDRVEILAGVRNGLSTGAPVAVLVANRDYQNWAPYMAADACDTETRRVSAPRPGHADYVGARKFGLTDCRNILERASARNTASVVALGGVARQFLRALGVEIASYVTRIGAAGDDGVYSFAEVAARADASAVRALDARAEAAMIAEIDRAKAGGDTVGGAFRVIAHGVRPGVGSCMETSRKLDTLLTGALGGLQGVKAVAVGDGEAYARSFGTAVHDAMYPGPDGGAVRRTNRAGGIEGGMSNGEDIVLSAVFKPIPTTMKGLPTVDLGSGEATVSSKERSDVCAVPAAAVVGEALAALTLADAIAVYTGGSYLEEILGRWK